MQQRGGRAGHTSKSQIQQNVSEKENSRTGKKGTHETVFLLISSTHQMANIISDDGHFAKEREKAGGREMKKGFMYLIIRWS